MKQLIFNDSQTIEVQAVYQEEEKLRIRLIHMTADEMKALFLDTVLTKQMTLKEDYKEKAVYENYTIFSYIKEEPGGIFEVEMLQHGKDADTRLAELEKVAAEVKEQAKQTEMDMHKAVAELTMLIVATSISNEGGEMNV